MNRLKFSSIRTNLTFWFLLMALVPLIIGIIIMYRISTKDIETETWNKLTAIRDLKVNDLENWIEERTGDLTVMSNDFELKLTSRELKGDTFLFNKEVSALLDFFHSSYLAYDELFIINARTGIIEISTNQSNIGKSQSNEPQFTVPLETKKLFIRDIFHSSLTNKITMTFSMPLKASQRVDSEIIGVLIARIDLENSLYPVLANRTGLGNTGETLIVNQDLYALNSLRWHENAPLNLKIGAEPAVNAAMGKTGIIKSKDYRGIEVLGAYTYIPATGWGFVCKQDMDELDEPVQAMGKLLIILLIITGFVIVVIVYFVSNSISSPLLKLNAVSKQIAGGNYSVFNSIDSKDEIGELGASINVMVKNIASKSTVQKGVSEISENLIGHETRKKYASTLLKSLINITSASMAVFYELDDSETEYKHLDSIGANKNLLQSFLAKNSEGELGNAISSQQIYHLKNLADDTNFKYKTSAGEIVPKEIITIPILGTKKVQALISLVNLNHFSGETIEILNLSKNALNTSYSNLMASEKTTILANNLLVSNQKLEAQTEELREQSEELQQQTDELQRSSDELQLQNQEMEMQRIQVEEANRLKSEFLSNMSHELRTPLNSINALSRVLIMQAKNKLSDEENEYLEVVERNGKRLLSLINDILDLSKIEAGKMELHTKEFSLTEMLEQITENILPLAKQKNIALLFDSSDERVKIETDENRLHQVLSNIVGNAVKFTDSGGVVVSVVTDHKTVQIEVRDTGIGISERMLPHIFEEFRQADGSTSRSYEGTGLGLAIAKKLIEALHGNIYVESKLGQGSVFVVSLPQKWEGQTEIDETGWVPSKIPFGFKKTILVVDDDIKFVKQISDSLRESGYNTIETTSGKEALQMAEKYKPYAITIDIVMPEMDGWEVLQKLKDNPETADIPAIVVSVTDDKQTSFALGAVGYVSKPVDRNLLLNEIKKLNAIPGTILIVDDNQFDRNQINDILIQENLQTIQAGSGKECLDLLDINQPDVLVLDLMMPEMNGFQVLEEIRKKPETTDLPVIVVTAKDLTAKDKNLLLGNVSSILTKGQVSPVQITNEITRILDEIKQKENVQILKLRKDKPLRILMVEDNKSAVVQVKKILENEGFLVDVAEDGKQALEYVKHTIPDGIVLDLMMPGMDGFEVLENMRSTDTTRKIPVLILTAKNLTKNDLSRLSENNVQQLIQKGDVDTKGLLGKVKTMLNLEIEPGKIIKPEEKPEPEIQARKIPVQVKKEGVFKILVVEDNPDNRLTVRAILQNKYAIIEAFDGVEGLEKVVTELPDLVLLDISLPKLNGFDVVKQIKNNEKTKLIPVIALTAKAMKNDKEEILAAGCDEYVAKPIEQEELLAKIEMFLK